MLNSLFKRTKMFLLCIMIVGLFYRVQGQPTGQFTYTITLVGINSNRTQGRVQVTYNSEDGTICNDQFDNVDATVICIQLGYSATATHTAVTDGRFGPGSGPIWYDDLQCTGAERFLWECVSRFNSSNCNHNQDAGVICSAANTSTPIINPPLANCTTSGDIRLIGPSEYLGIGFVEIRRNGIWGAVCDDNWGRMNAQVVCRMLCYDPIVAYAGTAVNINYAIGLVSRTFFADDVDCVGTETDITQCPQSNTGVHNCNPNIWEFASVSCVDIDHPRPPAPSPSLVCANVTMTVLFERSLDLSRNITSVTLRGATCSVVNVQNVSTLTSEGVIIPLYDCGTTRYTNQSHIFYTNLVAVEYTRTAYCAYADVCYESYLINVTCEYPRNLSISNGFTVITQSVTQRAPGAFEIEMRFYNDTFRTILIPPIVLICGTWLWVDLHLITTDTELKLIVPRCFATPFDQRLQNAMNCTLFENKCEVDPTLTFHPLTATVFGFAYTSYKFINYTSVIIHCDAWVCLKTEKNSDCDRSCETSSSGRRRREATTRPTYRISSPPITVQGSGLGDGFGFRNGILVNLGLSGSPAITPQNIHQVTTLKINPSGTPSTNQAAKSSNTATIAQSVNQGPTPSSFIERDQAANIGESKPQLQHMHFDHPFFGGLDAQLVFTSSNADPCFIANYIFGISFVFFTMYVL